MRCRDARRRIVQCLIEDEQAGPELGEHLRLCPACDRRMEEGRSVRDALRALAPADPPTELDELMAEGMRDALARPMQLDNPPADPTPEMPGQKKGGIVVLVLIGLLVVAVALLAVLAGEPEAGPAGPTVVLSEGEVQVSPPASRNWRPVGGREPLPPGSGLRTAPGAFVRVQDGPVLWSLPPVSRMAFGSDHQGELVAGRAYVKCTGGDDAPCELLTADGAVRCGNGLLVAFRTLKRLKVGCISGGAVAGEGEHAVELQPGQVVVLAEGRPCGPVRTARTAELAHFLRLFGPGDGHRLSPRHLLTVPLPPAGIVLPDSVALSQLDVRIVMRGPIALIEATMALRNDGPEAWQGTMRLGDATLPPPLAEQPAAAALAAGAEATLRAVALCVARGREDHYALGLLPEAWTAKEIERLTVQVDATADGGVRAFACPTLGEEQRKPGTVAWAWQGDRVSPGTPIVIECELAGREGADFLVLHGDEGTQVVTAWRPQAGREEWIRKGRNVFIAFDAAGDFGCGGMAAAQDVLEVLLNALPPACATALLAYDGTLKLEPGRLAAHGPERVEAMLKGLWALRDDGEPRPADFLHEAITGAAAPQEESLLIFVTGREGPDVLEACEAALRTSGVCLAVLQVGAERPAPAYQALAKASGGVALAMPARRAAEPGTLDFLTGLRSPAVRNVQIAPEGPGEGTVLLGPSDFANQPVVALVDVPKSASGVKASMSVEAGKEVLTRELVFEWGPDGVVAGEAPAALIRALRRAAEDVCIAPAGSARIR